MDTRARTEQIRLQVQRALAGSGTVVEGVQVHRAGSRSQLRVTVARDVTDTLEADPTSRVAALSLDEVATATRVVDEVVDSGDLMGPTAFTLEVSSPGVDQPLATPEQFRRNVGRLVELTLGDGSILRERIVAVDRDGIRLAGAEGSVLAFAEVATASVQIEFTRPDAEEDT